MDDGLPLPRVEAREQVVGAGVGAYAAGIFHLMTHAFFKGLLFLGAGSVMHAMSGELDMRKMGGLWKLLPLSNRGAKPLTKTR